MRIIDVDAHLHETLDWIAQTDGHLAEALGPPARFMDSAFSVFVFVDSSFQLLPEHQRRKDRWDLVPPGFVTHLQMTDDRQPDDFSYQDADGDAHFDAEYRLRWCDERGI